MIKVLIPACQEKSYVGERSSLGQGVDGGGKAAPLGQSPQAWPFILIGLISGVALFLLLGWKVYSMSRTA